MLNNPNSLKRFTPGASDDLNNQFSSGPDLSAQNDHGNSPSSPIGLTLLYAPDGNTALVAPGTLGTTVTKGTILSPTGTATTSPFVINISWDSSVASAPSGFQTAVISAAQYLESHYTNAATINISVGYGEVNGTPLGSGALGTSQSYLSYVSYASLLAALTANSKDATNVSVLASLPTAAPVGGYTWVSTAEAKALGLSSATGTATDGYVGFSSSYGFTYNNAGGVASGTYDFNGTALHELTEVMGRMMFTGGTIGPYAPSYTLLDLLHYSSAGVRDFSASTPGYFSIDGGVTAGGGFNTVSGGDSGDWGSAMGNDSLNAFSYSGVVNGFSAGDLTVLDALGWNLAGAAPTPPPPPPPPPPPAPLPVVVPPTGVSIAEATTSLAKLQGNFGMGSGKALALLTQIGGQTGDTFTYTLGGTGAGSFTLTSSGNVGTLSTGTAVSGGASGKVYALTVTANDTTAGVSSTASALDVVVGDTGSNTVPISALVGSSSTATPTFIYGLSGNDTLNGTGMTGKLWFDGGAGADTMTGGSGANTYLYGTTGESSVTAMDTITNFHAAMDTIDLTAISSHALSFLGAVTGSTIAGYAIGYNAIGGNTLVYVNTSASAISLTSASMEIKLTGSVALIGSDFLHH